MSTQAREAAGYGICTWSALFALPHLYWAAGPRTGLAATVGRENVRLFDQAGRLPAGSDPDRWLVVHSELLLWSPLFLAGAALFAAAAWSLRPAARRPA
jgi:hypothetical protein